MALLTAFTRPVKESSLSPTHSSSHKSASPSDGSSHVQPGFISSSSVGNSKKKVSLSGSSHSSQNQSSSSMPSCSSPVSSSNESKSPSSSAAGASGSSTGDASVTSTGEPSGVSSLCCIAAVAFISAANSASCSATSSSTGFAARSTSTTGSGSGTASANAPAGSCFNCLVADTSLASNMATKRAQKANQFNLGKFIFTAFSCRYFVVLRQSPAYFLKPKPTRQVCVCVSSQD
mmetsp:Transcript_28462/g.34572  ORF Transcript_28462/g.34572 Transcript_28462/m.34572 type:complete len:233 (+) Transcript_28462:1212-1910(+)